MGFKLGPALLNTVPWRSFEGLVPSYTIKYQTEENAERTNIINLLMEIKMEQKNLQWTVDDLIVQFSSLAVYELAT